MPPKKSKTENKKIEQTVQIIKAAIGSKKLKVQLEILKTQNDNMHRYLAQNPHLHPKVQLLMASHPQILTQRYLARYGTNITLESQTILANAEGRWIRSALATNSHIALETQLKLAKDTNSTVQEKLAMNENVQITAEFPAQFIYHNCQNYFKQYKQNLNKDTGEMIEALTPNWNNSLAELLVAVEKIITERE